VTSIETRASWFVAFTVLTVMSFAFGAPFISVVALKQIATELASARSVPALGYSLAWFGSAVGGIAMGHIAERVGTRWTVAFGAAMIGVGLAVSTGHGMWSLWLGHGLFIGLLGIGGINAPCYVYVTRWFDNHRGTALALISSGQYVAGTIWPLLFERGIAQLGWRETMLIFAAAVLVVVVPPALLIMRNPLELPASNAATARGRSVVSVLGLPPNLTLALLAAAAFMCCVPMAMPPSHLVAYCTDLGIAPAQGAAMLSVLLGCAFFSRQMWKLDRRPHWRAADRAVRFDQPGPGDGRLSPGA
jgi:MFS family permease